MGTGPFKLESWAKGSHLVLARWDGYRDVAAIALRRVTVRFISDAAAQVAALLAGDVEFFFNQSAAAINAIKGGQATAIAVTTRSRLSALPDVPTVEQGCSLPGFESSTWYGLFGPANMPPAITKKMSDAVIGIISKPEFKQWLMETQGITPAEDSSPAAFEKIHQADIKRWAEIVKMSGAQVD